MLSILGHFISIMALEQGLKEYDKPVKLLDIISEKKDKSEKRHFNYSMYLLFPVLFLPVGIITHPLSLKRLLY